MRVKTFNFNQGPRLHRLFVCEQRRRMLILSLSIPMTGWPNTGCTIGNLTFSFYVRFLSDLRYVKLFSLLVDQIDHK